MPIHLMLSRTLALAQRRPKPASALDHQFWRAGTLQSPILPRLSGDALTLVSDACAAYAGHMTLADWRDAEKQLARKVNYEKRKSHK